MCLIAAIYNSRISKSTTLLFTVPRCVPEVKSQAGIADPEVGKNRRVIQDRLIKTLTEDVLTHIKVFHLRGALDYRQLSGVHTLMMIKRKRTIARLGPAERTPEEQTLLDTYRKTVD